MDDIQLNLTHNENVYIEHFDINTMCLSFDDCKYLVKLFYFYKLVCVLLIDSSKIFEINRLEKIGL